jgi:hypothetical protein
LNLGLHGEKPLTELQHCLVGKHYIYTSHFIWSGGISVFDMLYGAKHVQFLAVRLLLIPSLNARPALVAVFFSYNFYVFIELKFYG